MLKLLHFPDCNVLPVALGPKDQMLHPVVTSLSSNFSNSRWSQFGVLIWYFLTEIQLRLTTRQTPPGEMGDKKPHPHPHHRVLETKTLTMQNHHRELKMDSLCCLWLKGEEGSCLGNMNGLSGEEN